MSNNKILKDGQGVEFTTKTTEDVSGINTSHVNVDSLPITQPLTDAQLRASTVPVSLPDGSQVNGPLAQSIINTDLLTGNVNGWFDAASFQSGAIQIIASAGISAGQIFFEQTNDNSNSVGLALLATEATAVNTNPVNAAFAVAANANRLFRFSINARYIRVRISTAFVGGTVRVVGFFSEFPFTPNVMNVQQTTAGNLAVTATVTSTTANIGASGMIAYADSSTNLASSATFTGTSRDGGATQGYNRFVAKAFANVEGTLRIEQSSDNTNWRRATADTVVAAGSVVELATTATARYHRVIYINGAIAQTQVLINSAYLRI
jgi:hypothetical protein